ncbi:MAG: hypothetical protein JNL74_18525 [Fibrobacteres bacterium]|nr:hypothetical protein [Fibrobacterota bacterium]
MKILLLIVLLVIIGCAPYSYVGGRYDTFSGSVYTIEADAGCAVGYKSYELLRDEQLRSLSISMEDDSVAKETLANIPKSGILIVSMSTQNIYSSNPKNWKYIVKDASDKIVLKTNGRESIPDFMVTQFHTVWNNADFVFLNNPIDFPIKFYVINALTDKRSCFLINKNTKSPVTESEGE